MEAAVYSPVKSEQDCCLGIYNILGHVVANKTFPERH